MKGKKEIIVGIFALLGVVGVIWGFFFLKGNNLLKDTKEYYVTYETADGLTANNPVTLNGVQIGHVTSVNINKVTFNNSIVKFTLTDEEIKLPIGTKIELQSSLLGTVVLGVILPEDRTLGHYNFNDTLQGRIKAGLTDDLIGRLDPIQLELDKLLKTTKGAIATIDTIFSGNTSNLNQSFNGIKKIVYNVESMTDSLNLLVGTLSANRFKIIKLIDNVNSITGNLAASNEEITSMLANFNSFSSKLDSLDLEKTLSGVDTLLAKVDYILDDINNGDGTINKLLQDTLLYDNINDMITEATSLVNNIKQHPNRYIQFSMFGGRYKGANLDTRDEKRLRQFAKDSLRFWYP